MKHRKSLKLLNNNDNYILKLYCSDLNSFKSLNKQEEHVLIDRYQRLHDIEARDMLVRSNLKYAFQFASRYLNKGLDIHDLISLANDGLIQAIEKFDLSKDVKLNVYANFWMAYYILTALRQKCSRNEISLPVENDYDDVYNDNFNEDGERVKTKQYDFSVLSYEDNVISENNEFLATICNVLDEREKDIIYMYYGCGYNTSFNLEDIGEKYCISKERVRKIMSSAFRKLRSEALILS